MSDTHSHLEEHEHMQHAAEDPFDRRVAMTMTVVAALLAVVTLLSHRSHTTTLRLTTLAAVHKGKASDEWNYYQAKNVRNHAYQTAVELTGIVAKEAGSSAKLKAAQERWNGQLSKYKTELPEQMHRAQEFDKQADAAEIEAEHVHRQAEPLRLGRVGGRAGADSLLHRHPDEAPRLLDRQHRLRDPRRRHRRDRVLALTGRASVTAERPDAAPSARLAIPACSETRARAGPGGPWRSAAVRNRPGADTPAELQRGRDETKKGLRAQALDIANSGGRI